MSLAGNTQHKADTELVFLCHIPCTVRGLVLSVTGANVRSSQSSRSRPCPASNRTMFGTCSQSDTVKCLNIFIEEGEEEEDQRDLTNKTM